MGNFSCGLTATEDDDNQALTDALVKYGGAAIPALEKALQSVQDHDDSPYSLNAKWLMQAYARILGPDAYRRLHQMAGLPRVRYFAQALDQSMALAFGFTSYVSSWRKMSCECEGRFSVDCNACSPEQQRPFSLYLVCSSHPPDPRIRPLDELILTWERGNRVLLKANLGPRAKASLDQLLAGKTWAQLHGEFWGKHTGDVAVGYTFGPSKSGSALVQFKRGVSGQCGEVRIDFVPNGEDGYGRSKCLINNSDLGRVLQTIAACAIGAE
jgi:hypothetical protein